MFNQSSDKVSVGICTQSIHLLFLHIAGSTTTNTSSTFNQLASINLFISSYKSIYHHWVLNSFTSSTKKWFQSVHISTIAFLAFVTHSSNQTI